MIGTIIAFGEKQRVRAERTKRCLSVRGAKSKRCSREASRKRKQEVAIYWSLFAFFRRHKHNRTLLIDAHRSSTASLASSCNITVINAAVSILIAAVSQAVLVSPQRKNDFSFLRCENKAWAYRTIRHNRLHACAACAVCVWGQIDPTPETYTLPPPPSHARATRVHARMTQLARLVIFLLLSCAK